MSGTQDPPAGWTLSQFKAVCAEVGTWTWGTVQGAFNEKASLTQIIVDAVIGMIPLVGDATAARDLIAVVIGLSVDEEKRNSKWEWILLVVLLFALIPVFGGVIKGVGRITIKIGKEAAGLVGAARAAHLQSGAKELVEFLNRIGVKNAEKWLLALRIGEHTGELVGKFTKLITTIDKILLAGRGRLTNFLNVTGQIDRLRVGLEKVLTKGNEMIPVAVKELDQQLREIQAYVRTGGESTSRLARHQITTGQRITTRAEERRLVQNGLLPVRSWRGGFAQNPASSLTPKRVAKYYTPQPGYPDLRRVNPTTKKYDSIAAFAGKMVNRQLKTMKRFSDSLALLVLLTASPSTNLLLAGAGGGLANRRRPPESGESWLQFLIALMVTDFSCLRRLREIQGQKQW